jgi:hypothetical protein
VSRFPNPLGAHPLIAPRDAIRARARELRRTRAHVLARSICLSGMQEHADDEAGTAAGDRIETPARVPYGSVERNGNSERAAPTVLVATPVDLVTERNSRTPRTRRGSIGRRPAGTDGRSASTRSTVLGVPEFPCGCHTFPCVVWAAHEQRSGKRCQRIGGHARTARCNLSMRQAQEHSNQQFTRFVTCATVLRQLLSADHSDFRSMACCSLKTNCSRVHAMSFD